MGISIFQTPEWEQFKLATGYQKAYRIDGVLVLVKKLPLGGSMLYSPRVSSDQVKKIKVQEFLSKIAEIAKENKAIFFRAEFAATITRTADQLADLGFIKAFEEMQPEHTLILDLNQSEEEILSQMKPKGRYNIKVAERSGVKVQTSKSVENFYNLYALMASRQAISYRGKNYFQTLIDIFSGKDYILVFDAFVSQQSADSSLLKKQPTTNSQQPTYLASAIVSFVGDRAIYLFGGSSDEYRNLMAPYKLHWEVIREAKRRGFKEYDFFGVAPEGAKNHPWAGVTAFKEKFGGRHEEILGSYDLVFNRIKYKAFKIAEKIRR